MIVQRVRQRAHPSLVSFRGCIQLTDDAFSFSQESRRKKILSKRLFSLSFVLRAVKRLSCAHQEDDDGDADDDDDAFFSRAKFDGVVSALFY